MNVAALFLLLAHVSCTTLKERSTHGKYASGSYRIVGGKPAKVGEFRGQVSLQTRIRSHICGGILIDPLHVVTVGHCHQKEKRIGYIVGDDLSVAVKGSATRQIREVVNFVPHPLFSNVTMENDIAVIRVNESFTTNERFGPMRRSEFTPPVGAHCLTVGWGYARSAKFGAHISYDLLKANVEVVETEFCNSSISYNGEILPGMFCAGHTRGGGADACEGDSGGLLTCGGMDLISGVTSFGYECGMALFPGVYTDISMYNVWIDSIISQKTLPYYEFTPFKRERNHNYTDSTSLGNTINTNQILMTFGAVFLCISIFTSMLN